MAQKKQADQEIKALLNEINKSHRREINELKTALEKEQIQGKNVLLEIKKAHRGEISRLKSDLEKKQHLENQVFLEVKKAYHKDIRKLNAELINKEQVITTLDTLIEVNSIITGSLDKVKVLKNILDETKKLMHCKRSSILLVDRETAELKFAHLSDDTEKKDLKDVSLKMGEGIAGSVWERGQPVLIEDARNDVRFSKVADEKTDFVTRSLIAVPLITDGRVVGVMEAITDDETCFNEFDVSILTHLATQAAIALDNAELYEMAITDGMTKLFIHRYFQQRLEEEFNRAKRYNNHLSIVMFDIDHFKGLNDNYGHQTGDEFLIKTAKIIKNSCRSSDVPCRYGGEEMSIILPRTDRKNALLFAERIRKKIETLEVFHNKELVQTTVSGGVASFKEDNPSDRVNFIKMVDTALYFSKDTGRNRMTCFNEDLFNNPGV